MHEPWRRLTDDEELDLLVRTRFGDANARQCMVSAHLPFVYKMANKLGRGRPIRDDLINEGVLGLCYALDRFDLHRPFRFLTYAEKAVFTFMRKCLEQASTPLSGATAAKEAKRRDALGGGDAITAVLAVNAFRTRSLDEPISYNDNEIGCLGDNVASDLPLVDLELGDNETSQWVQDVLSQMELSPVESAIVTTRLMGGGTLADVAVQVNLSRERIRQIEERLLPKLARRFKQEPDGRDLAKRLVGTSRQIPPVENRTSVDTGSTIDSTEPQVDNRCQQCGKTRDPNSFVGKSGERVRRCAPCRARYAGPITAQPPLPSKVPALPDLRAQLVVNSYNRKLGGIPSSVTSRGTCPPSCSFYGAGCYADGHLLAIHWRRVGEHGDSWANFCASVARLPEGQLWRHNTAGDLPGVGEEVDKIALEQLVAANVGKRGFTFTHKKAFEEVRRANDRGFTINLSADSLEQADELFEKGAGPVVVVIRSTTPDRGTKTSKGRKVIICPAQKTDGRDITCASCGLCAISTRKAIIGFRAHGVHTARVDKIVSLHRKDGTTISISSEVAKQPKVEEHLCAGCTHPENWHVAGIWMNESDQLRVCKCGCENFRPLMTKSERQERKEHRLATSMKPPCPALRPSGKRECGKPAVWGEWCALHGQRVMRGVEVRRADRPDDTLPFTET